MENNTCKWKRISLKPHYLEEIPFHEFKDNKQRLQLKFLPELTLKLLGILVFTIFFCQFIYFQGFHVKIFRQYDPPRYLKGQSDSLTVEMSMVACLKNKSLSWRRRMSSNVNKRCATLSYQYHHHRPFIFRTWDLLLLLLLL